MTPFAMPLPAPWTAAPSEPPDVSATPQAHLRTWTAFERVDPPARATIGCFGFQLGGYTDELAPIVFERTEPFAVRAAGGLSPGSFVRQPADLGQWPHRQMLQFDAPDSTPVQGALAFGFTGDELVSCFAVCRETTPGGTGGCAGLVDTAAFTVALTPAPEPSWGQSVALGVLANPRAAALGVALALVVCSLALLFSRGSRA